MALSFVPIFLAGLSSVVIAFIWYHPKVLGSAWMRMSGITPEMAERGKKNMPLMIFFALLSSMFVAYVMNFMFPALVYPDWVGALELGFWCWAGFIAPAMLGTVLWERKPFRLYIINVTYWLLTLLAMAFILLYGNQMLGVGIQYDVNASAENSYVAE